MAWYRTGTVAVTNGSKTVTGTAAWINNVQPGDAFVGPDGMYYEVDQVVSNTSILLVENYAGTTVGSGGAYKIIPTQGRVRDLAAQVLQLITDYGAMQSALTISSGSLGLGKTPNASAKLDVAGQVWVDAPSGSATVNLLTSGAAKGKLTATSAGKVAIESNGAEVATFLNGNVGIGTASPAYRLHAASSSASVLGVFRDLDVTSVGSAAAFIDLGARNGSTFTAGAQLQAVLNNPPTTGYLSVATLRAGVLTEGLRLTSAGLFGINTTGPTATLHVVGTVRLDVAVSSSATAGGSSALPAAPAGYMAINIGGITYKVPYYPE